MRKTNFLANTMQHVVRNFFILFAVFCFSSCLFASCIAPANPPSQPPDKPDPKCDECKGTGSPNYIKAGNHTFSVQDLSLPGRGFGLSVTRVYDSAQMVDGLFGVGWSSNLTSRLYYVIFLYSAPSTFIRQAAIIMPNGRTYVFTQNSDGSFAPPVGINDTLVRNSDGTFDLTPALTRSRYHYAQDGRLLSQTDDNGNVLVYSYDGSGRLTAVADSGSPRSLTIGYGANGRVSYIQDSAGRVVQYGYNTDGTLAQVTDPAGRQTRYSYTPGRFGIPLLTQIKDHWNRVISDITYYPYVAATPYSYNRVKSYTEGGETYTYTYNKNGVSATKKDSAGNSYAFEMDADGLITQRNFPAPLGTSSVTYYPDGKVNTATDEMGIKTAYTYNPNGSTESVTRDSASILKVRFDYTYDQNFPERVTSILPKDPTSGAFNANWQGWKYDYYQAGEAGGAAGALHRVYRVQSDGATLDLLSTYTYNAAGQTATVADAGSALTAYGYDSATGDLQSVSYPPNSDSGAPLVYQYGRDSFGRVTSVTDPAGHTTSYQYDAIGRITSVTLPRPSPGSPLNFTTTYSYDNFDAASGLVFTIQTDPNGKVTKQGYDQYGHMVQSIDALANVTTFAYSKGLLSSVTDANGNVTAYTYNAARMLSATIFPDGATETYTYNSDGTLNTKTDRKGQVIDYAYDHLKRVTKKYYPGTPSVTYTYLGQKLTKVVDTLAVPSETHTFTYDVSYRVSGVTQPSRGTVNYTFDANDRSATMSLAGGPSAGYGYYPDGSLKTITWSSVAGQFQYSYTQTGQYGSIAFPNGQHRDYNYDDQGRLTQLANTHPAAGNLGAFAYGYDSPLLGQRTSMTSNLGATNYSYDSNYQLNQASYPNVPPFNGEVDSWTYDAIGNRLTNTVNGSSTSYSYYKNSSNQLNGQRLQSDGAKTYTYDNNGNLTADGTYTYTWDYENRLTGISGGGLAASYKYDYLGRRTSKTVNGVTTTYLYDEQNLIRESGVSTADYIFGPGIDEPLAMSRSGGVSYYNADGLGSITSLTDSAALLQNSYVYDSWGLTRSKNEAFPQSFTYTARETGEAGLMYYRARWMGPSIGRFISEDPDPTFPSRYAYANNNPVLYRDPSGLITAGGSLGGCFQNVIVAMANIIKRTCTAKCTLSDWWKPKCSSNPAPECDFCDLIRDPSIRVELDKDLGSKIGGETIDENRFNLSNAACARGSGLVENVMIHELAHICLLRHGIGRTDPRQMDLNLKSIPNQVRNNEPAFLGGCY